MPAPRTALAALGRTAMDAARALGLDVEELLARAGVVRASLEDADGRMPADALLDLWELVGERSGDPFFGLHAGERFVSAKTIHIVGYAARNCLTLGDCYERTDRFARLTNEASEITLRVKGERATMRVGPSPGSRMWPRCYAEMALASYLTLGRNWTDASIAPVEVTFQHASPGDVAEYTRIFGANVRFGAAKNELVLPASVLDLPLREPDPSLREYLDSRAAVLLLSLKEGRHFENSVRSRIDEALARGTPTVDQVARLVGMSGRTLQRRLTDEGLSFSELVDDVRRTSALGLIANPRFSIFEVAALAGYRDAESFRAAFVRWTGMTPRDYRRTRSTSPP